MRQLFIFVWVALATVTFISCKADKPSPDVPVPEVTAKNIGGVIEKGPFITGTSIKLQILDKNLNPAGQQFEKQIENDFGGYSFENIEADYVEMIANGYYFNELSGALSKSTITLRSISQITEGKTSNLNLLTTLQSQRLKVLITDGKSYEQALIQSQREVLELFNIKDQTVSFDQMNITGSDNSNGIMLAISVILQNNRTEAQLSELISKLANDLADNGTVDSQTLKDEITRGSQAITSYDAIRTVDNIVKRYNEIGKEDITVANFYNFIDSDGDGRLNNQTNYLEVGRYGASFVSDYNEAPTSSKLKYTTFSNAKVTVEIPSDVKWIKVNDALSTDAMKVIEIEANGSDVSRSTTITFVNEVDNSLRESRAINQNGIGEKFRVLIPSLCTQNSIETKAINVTPISNIAFVAFDALGNSVMSYYSKDRIDNAYGVSSYYNFTAKLTGVVDKFYSVINGGIDLSSFDGNFDQFISKVHSIDVATRTTNCMHIGKGDARVYDGEYLVDLTIGHAFSQLKINVSKDYALQAQECKLKSITLIGALDLNIFENFSPGGGPRTGSQREIEIPMDIINDAVIGSSPTICYVDKYFVEKLTVSQIKVTVLVDNNEQIFTIPMMNVIYNVGSIYRWDISISNTNSLMNSYTGQFHRTEDLPIL